ncbi:aspartate kinase [Candidatus Micrarchaeota archaeon]|nr:aspartate kinase [Candidatus Micrarchaeota archaeon]
MAPRLIVAKFGGSSLANGECIQRVGEIVRSDRARRLVVVSAPGAIKSQGIPKVTDQLIALGETYRADADLSPGIAQLQARFADIETSLGQEGLACRIPEIVRERLLLTRRYGRLDSLVALGEELNARLFAQYLDSQDLRVLFLDPARVLPVSENGFRDAHVLPERFGDINSTLASALSSYDVVIIPGFYGSTSYGEIRTFPRGGSDYTAAIVAAAIGASLHENFTDVDGIRAVDPNLIPDARRIDVMSLAELCELTLDGGFDVFQANAVAPLAEARIPIHLRSTFNLSALGTHIVPVLPEPVVRDRIVRGIAYRDKYTTIKIRDYTMGDQVGVLSRLGQIFARRGISIERMPSTQITGAVTVRSAAVATHLESILAEIRSIGRNEVEVTENLGIVSVVGEGLAASIHALSLLFNRLANNSIPVVRHDGDGASVTLQIPNGDALRAVQILYDQFIRGL